jgi:3-oxoacyl-[acyl-carrier-protein] synthase II
VGLVLPSFLPGFLGEKLGAGVGRGSVSLACNSGLVALEQGWRAVREGGARWFLAGGVEEDSPHTWWAFDGMRALARSATDGADPSRASRPFSHDAHGIVPAGAASFVVLEALDRAIARGATVHAVLHACRHEGSSGREPFTAFEPAAYARVASDALAQGGVPPGAVDLVTGHTHSTRADCDELRALDPLLDLASRGVRVNTPKSLVGHSLGASGLVDVIHLAMQLRRQHALGNHHITALPPDAERFARNVLLPPAPAALRFALKVGYAAGGSYAAVVLGSGP